MNKLQMYVVILPVYLLILWRKGHLTSVKTKAIINDFAAFNVLWMNHGLIVMIWAAQT